MAAYLCILLNRRAVVAVSDVDADDDEDALIQAIAICDIDLEATGLDLWHQGQKVHHYDRPIAAA